MKNKACGIGGTSSRNSWCCRNMARCDLDRRGFFSFFFFIFITKNCGKAETNSLHTKNWKKKADIFLERRTENDIVRNAMVGIFLRLTEVFFLFFFIFFAPNKNKHALKSAKTTPKCIKTKVSSGCAFPYDK